MKALKKETDATRSFVLTLQELTCEKLDDIAAKLSTSGAKVYRADVIRAILDTALDDKDFTVTIKK